MKKLSAVVAVAAMTLSFAGCADEGSQPPPATHTAVNGDVFNDADVTFATGMIPHHAEALQMVDLTRGRTLSREVRRLAEAIQLAQGPEIEQMKSWLTDWDQPVPETVRDHSNAHGDGHATGDGAGMMGSEEMAGLEAADDQEFEDRWLQLMIEHHQGAVEMAGTEQSEGTFQPALDVAESIESSQRAEIERMEELLAS